MPHCLARSGTRCRHSEEDAAMPAHMRFVVVLKVPHATAKANWDLFRKYLSGEPDRIAGPITPADVFRSFKASTKQREIAISQYSTYRQYMDSYNPGNPRTYGNPDDPTDPRNDIIPVTVPQEDWELYFQKGTQFDMAVCTYFEDNAYKQGYSFTLILNHAMEQLKRIEVMGPDISSPSIIWMNGKGAFPNARAA
jgi:hypothetical protein